MRSFRFLCSAEVEPYERTDLLLRVRLRRLSEPEIADLHERTTGNAVENGVNGFAWLGCGALFGASIRYRVGQRLSWRHLSTCRGLLSKRRVRPHTKDTARGHTVRPLRHR